MLGHHRLVRGSVVLLLLFGPLGGLLSVPTVRGVVFFQDSFDPAQPGWNMAGAWHTAVEGTDSCYGNTTTNHPTTAASSAGTMAFHFDTAPPATPGAECTYDLDVGGFSGAHRANLTSPTFDLSSAGPSVWLHFATWRETEAAFFDFMNVSVDFGSGPVLVSQVTDPPVPQTSWETLHVDVSVASGSASVQLLFGFDTVDNILNAYAGWYVDNVTVDDVSPTVDTLTFEPFDAAPPLAAQGATNVLMAGMNLSVDANSATVDTVSLALTGNPPLDADVTIVGLLLDGGDGVFDLVDDLVVGFGPFTGGVSAISLFTTVTVFAGAPERLWIAYNIAATAGVGNRVGALFNATSVTPFGPDIAVCVGCPLDTYDGTKTEITGPSGDNVTVSMTDLSPPTVLAGDTDVLMAAFAASVDTNSALLQSLTLNLTGVPPSDLDVSRVVLLEDDGDSVFNPVADQLLDMDVFSGNLVTLTANLPLSPGSPLRLWLTYDVAPGATVGDFIGVRLYSNASLAVAAPDDALCVGCPLDTYDGLKTEIVAPANGPPEAGDLAVDGGIAGTLAILHILNVLPPLMEWTYSDPEPDPQTDFEVRVGSAPGLNDFWAPGPAGTTGTMVPYGGAPLVDASDYYFGVRVHDGTQWSPWNETLFHVNGIPPVPTTPVSPADGLTIAAGSGTTVSWSSGGPDPETDPVIHDWWVATDPGFTALVASGSTPGLTSTGFTTVPTTQYFWRVRANDTYEVSANASFSFNTSAIVDNAPTAGNLTVDGYVPGSPEIGHILSPTPVFNWTYFDPEGVLQTDHEVRVGSAPGLSDLWGPGPTGAPGLTTTYAGTPLAPGTDYWFGVRVHDGNAWSPWNDTLFHTNGLPPPAMAPVTPPDVGRVVAGTQTVSWTPGGVDPESDPISYDWEVATDPGFTASVASGSGPATSSTAFPTLAGTTYHWRVRACDLLQCSGTWSAWSFSANVAPVVSITSPAGGEVFTGGVARPMTLSVTDADDAAWTANVEFSDDGGTSWAPLGGTVSLPPLTPSWTPPCPSTTQGRLRVTVADGLESGQDTTASFAIDCTAPMATVVPADGATNIALTTTVQATFTEPVSTLLTSFWLNGSSGTVAGSLTWSLGDTVFSFTAAAALAPCTRYTIAIVGVRDLSDPGNPMPPFLSSFTTACPPEARDLTVDGFSAGTAGIGHVLTADPAFAWAYFDEENDPQTDHQVRVGTSPGGNEIWAPPAAGTAGLSLTYAGPALADGTDYYFAVRVFDGSQWSGWNETLFHTNTPPPAPALASPADNALNVTYGSTPLTWSAATDAEGDLLTYDWELSTSPTFATLEDSGTTAGTSATVGTSAGTAHYWRVRANDSWEVGTFSAASRFTTASAPPTAGTLTVRVESSTGAVPSATVVVRYASNGTQAQSGTTDAQGDVAFANLPFGNYTVHATAPGFEAGSRNVTLAGTTASVTVTLTSSPPVDGVFPWWIVLVLLATVIGGIVFLLLWRRKKKTTEEPPPKEWAEPEAAREAESATETSDDEEEPETSDT